MSLRVLIAAVGGLALAVPCQTRGQTSRPLALGETAERDGLSITVASYATSDKCRGSREGAAPGAKLAYLWIAAKNVSNDVLEHPALIVELEGVDKHSGWFGGTVCRYDSEAFSCKGAGRLYPDVTCEGWELFEVPAKYEFRGKRATVSLLKHGKGIEKVGVWQLAENTP